MNTEVWVSNELFIMGFLLILVGFVMIALDLLLLSSKVEGRKADVKGGGVIIIGPIPIVFGSDRKSVLTLSIIGAAITVLLLIITYILPKFWGG